MIMTFEVVDVGTFNKDLTKVRSFGTVCNCTQDRTATTTNPNPLRLLCTNTHSESQSKGLNFCSDRADIE